MDQIESKGQSYQSVKKNSDFFCENLENYNQNIQELDSYKIIGYYINKVIYEQKIDDLLDIGNGGVFDYDTNLVKNIVGLDLFLDKLPATFSCPNNVVMKTGSALDIPEANNTFGGVIMVMLIHHLIGNTVKSCIKNVETSIDEAYRVLKPGGKFIIVESCVPNWFYQFEKIVFRVASKIIEKTISHPATLQYPTKVLKSMIEKKFGPTQVINVPLGRWILIYGFKVPRILTPVSSKIFIAEKHD